MFLFNNPFKLSRRQRLTPEQQHAEKRAIELLTRAQRLLMEDDRHVDEAQRLRFQVTDELLPPRRMFIVGKHPRSLLSDVDRRIRHARIRLIRNAAKGMKFDRTLPDIQINVHPLMKHSEFEDFEEAVKEISEFELKRQNRYGLKTAQLEEQRIATLTLFLLLGLGFLMFLVYLSNTYATNDLYNAFDWIKQR